MKRTLHFLSGLIFLSLFCGTARAQWTALPLMITGTDTASSVSMIRSSGGKLFICTDKGLYVSYDDGDNWVSLTYAKTNTAGKKIISFYYDNDVDKLYAGGDSAVFASTDNGATWSLTALKNIDRANDIGKAGFNILVSHGVPGFPAGGVYYSGDNLATYKAAVIPYYPAFGFQASGALIFAGGKDGAYVSGDMGLTWSLSGTGHPAGARYAPLALHHGSLYAGDINGHGLWRSNDNGNIWSEVSSTIFKNFCQVFDIASGNKAIAVIAEGACNTAGPVKISADSGKTWVNPPGLPAGYYTRLGRNTPGDCFYIYDQNSKALFRNCSPSLNVAEPGLNGGVRIYPNPVSRFLSVDGLRSAAVQLFDVSGRQVYQKSFREEDIRLDLEGLQPGSYFLILQDGTQRITRTLFRQ